MWSTFIHRGSTDDVTERREAVVGRDLLSPFQQAGPGSEHRVQPAVHFAVLLLPEYEIR